MNDMKFGDLLKYSYLKTIREKKGIYFIVVLSVLLILLLAVLNYRTSFFKRLDADFYTNPSSRSLMVDPNPQDIKNHWDDDNYDYGFDKILKIEHVVDMYYFPLDNNYEITSSFKNDLYDGKIVFLYGSKGTIPKLTSGRMFDENETGVAICSNYFFPSEVYDKSLFSKNKILYEKDLLNKTFETETNVFKYENGPQVIGKLNKIFKIVGLFDTLSADGDLDVCYIPSKVMEEIYNATLKNFNDPSYTKSFSYVVTTDNYDNMESVVEEIKKLGFRVNPRTTLDTVYISKLKRICNVIVIFIIISIIAISIFYVKKKIYNTLYETGVSMVLGYTINDVILINAIRTAYLSLISCISGFVIFKILLIAIKSGFKERLLLANVYVLFNDYLFIYCLGAIVVLVIPLIVSMIVTKFYLKSELINLMRNDKE